MLPWVTISAVAPDSCSAARAAIAAAEVSVDHCTSSLSSCVGSSRCQAYPKDGAPPSGGPGGAQGLEPLKLPWTYTATMQQRARLQQPAPHIVILIIVLAALRGGRVRRVLLLPLGPLLALLLVLPVPARRREGDCSHTGALDLRSRVPQPGACGYVVDTLQHEQMQGSACTHFFLLSFLTLASLSRLSPAASCIRSSSCFFRLPKWCASGGRQQRMTHPRSRSVLVPVCACQWGTFRVASRHIDRLAADGVRTASRPC